VFTQLKQLQFGDNRPHARRAQGVPSWKLAPVWPVAVLALAVSSAFADDTPVSVDPVVVSATRVNRPSFDLPVAIDSVDASVIRQGEQQVNLSETLSRVPGLYVQNRQDYAQDLQISSRGFGARTAFGVGGIRLFADGIPASQPDGQGQAATFDLGSAQRIEVMRGPFSSLYGNASGGVIQIFTEDGPPRPEVDFGAWFGSYDAHREFLKAGGESGAFNYIASVASFETDGYRDHSHTLRDTANAKLTWKPDAADTVTLIYNGFAQPNALDAAGLSKAEVAVNPRAVDPSSLLFNTRKSIYQNQMGLVYERDIGSDDILRATTYAGYRRVEQFQAIPVAAQASPTSPGGVIDLNNDYDGVDLRWIHHARVLGEPLTFTVGVNYDNLLEHRMGFQNFIGTVTGIKGALRRNEDDTVGSFNQYAQMEWAANDRLSFMLGVRATQIAFKSVDFYIAPKNPDDSGSVNYNNVSPAAGVLYKLAPGYNIYANAGRGFETPTLDNIAYRPGGQSGLNFGLQPSVSNQFEIGIKALPDPRTRINAALFDDYAHNEIVVLTSTGGRSTYQNASNTRREGAELSAATEWGKQFSGVLSYTYVSAIYLDAYLTCVTTTCATPTTPVAAGNRMPGVPHNNAYAELAWHNATGYFAALELRANSAVYPNDINSEYAPGYFVASVRGGLEQRSGGWRITEFARLDNIFNRNYIGAIIVDDSNSRFYEPAPKFNYTVGVSASYNF
jgi:iron complex outermembrane recepter protein